jgi:hypothetical protein
MTVGATGPAIGTSRPRAFTGDRLYASNPGSASVSGYTDNNGSLSLVSNAVTDPGTVAS